MKYEFIGTYKEGTSDKVWCALLLKDEERYGAHITYATVWGRRGKTLQSKVFNGTRWEMKRIIDKKRDKGYIPANKNHLDEIYPEFEQDLETTAVWAIMKGC